MRRQGPSAAPFATGFNAVTDKCSGSALSGNHHHLIQAVHCAWAATLPSTPFEPDKSWSDIGLDSLKTLEFVLRLERSLGMRITFDAMTPECTAADLIRLLASNKPARPGFEPQKRVFLVPGILGDEPRLATFRKALSDEVTFEILEYPDIEVPTTILRSVAAMATALVNQVLDIQPEGDIILAGFSFGGLVAQEMASQFELRGRRVRFVAVFDGPLGSTAPQRSLYTSTLLVAADDIAEMRKVWRQRLRLIQSKLRTWAEFTAALDWPILTILMRLGAWELARRYLLRAMDRHDLIWLNHRRRRLLFLVRGWAMLRWRPVRSNASTLLVVSESNFASVEAWQSICSRLRVIRVPVDHWKIFEPGPLAGVRNAFLDNLSDLSDQEAA